MVPTQVFCFLVRFSL
ncbi:rCG52053 [Rattus norvegicus]|uniref:RCG52053 n=1 Tax=Rattus norvegicus TaxID=10116 RepID=A6K363_RAT|nr:rCG52053 [Rattus norvegicus]